MTNPDVPRIGFIGAGKMATALARGWIQAGLTTPARIKASDPHPDARASFTKITGIECGQANETVVAESDLVVVAVKPKDLEGLLDGLASSVTGNHLVISIAAGVTLRTIGDLLGHARRVIRVMPNTPCLVGASASAYAPGTGATADDINLVQRLMSAVGRAFAVSENLLDAVTGLSGSGPAYVFLVIEALADGGVRMGLPREVASQLAAQTVFGSAKLMLETGQHPAALKDMVASPGGTTIAGLHALERGGLRAALMNAVEAATERAEELSGK